MIDKRMQQVLKDYIDRPWPTKPANKRRSSTEKNLQRCGTNCDCTSYAQCQQNAAAYLAASEYCGGHADAVDKSFKSSSIKRPTIKCPNKHHCAASGTNHRVRVFYMFYYLYNLIGNFCTYIFLHLPFPLCPRVSK